MPEHLLPPNATAAERALSLATARVLDVPAAPVRTLWNPQTCPAAVLPWLAWSLSVEPWRTDWTEAQKRAAIAAAVEIHKIRGTVGAVIRALETLGYEVRVDESGDPYCFRVLLDVDGKNYDEAAFDAAEAAVLVAKNARSHLTGIVAAAKRDTTLYAAGAVADGQTTTVCYFEKPVPRRFDFATHAVRVTPLWQQVDFRSGAA